MKPTDSHEGELFASIRYWGGRWCSLWSYRLYVDPPSPEGDYVACWKLDLGPFAIDLPWVRLRRDWRKKR